MQVTGDAMFALHLRQMLFGRVRVLRGDGGRACKVSPARRVVVREVYEERVGNQQQQQAGNRLPAHGGRSESPVELFD